MIVGCPQCNRRYRLGEEYLNKYICVCSAVLKVTASSTDSLAKTKETQSASTSKLKSNTVSSEP